MANNKYKPSGKASVFGMIRYFLFGLIGALLLMGIYVYVVNLMPNMGLRGLVFVGILILLSAWMHHLAKAGKVRSPGKAFWMSFFVILLASYPFWALHVVYVNGIWEYDKSTFWTSHFTMETLQQFLYLLAHPKAIFTSLQQISSVGYFSIRGEMVKGAHLGIYWLIQTVLFLLVPSFRAMSQGYKIFSETQNRWLTQKAEIPCAYIKEHRALRRQLIKGDVSGLDDIHYYKVQGQEAHGTVTFYHTKGNLSPYVSIQMVKAVQIGPKRMKHFYIPIVEQWDLGQDKEEEIFTRLLEESGLTREKVTGRLSYKERHFLRGKKNQWSDSIRESIERQSNRVTIQDSGNYKPGEETTGIEEVTVYAPTITPEMEQQYLEKKAREEQERIWAENREEIKNRKTKNKRHSTRIK